MSEVYILYSEYGAYSDYGLGILGVFSTPDLAKAFVAAECEAAVKRHRSNAIYANRTDWKQDDDGNESCEIAYSEGHSHFDTTSWTIDKRIIDEPFTERPPLEVTQ